MAEERSKYLLIKALLKDHPANDWKEEAYKEELMERLTNDCQQLESLYEANGLISPEEPRIEYFDEQRAKCAESMRPIIESIFLTMRQIDRAKAMLLRQDLFSPDNIYLDEDIPQWISEYEDELEEELMDLRSIDLDLDVEYPEIYGAVETTDRNDPPS